MEPIEHINYTETGNIQTNALKGLIKLRLETHGPFFRTGNVWSNDEKECTYYHELNFTDWCQFSQNEPTCTLDDVFVQ